MNDLLESLYTLFGFFAEMGEYPNYINEYYSDVFPVVALWLLLAPLLTAVLYYPIFGRSTYLSGENWVWFTSLVLLFSVVSLATGYQAMKETQQVEVCAFVIYLSLFNGILASLFYFVLSLAGRKFSIHAKYTPF
jgi:FtsH-binding integral membrane protein